MPSSAWKKKTTSVTLLRHVLSALEPTGSIGTLGAFDPTGEPVPSEAGNLTTPGPIDLQATLAALVARGARGATMEVSSHSLDQGRVEGLVFRAAVFTNLTRDHLDYHKTLEDYFRAKAKLVQYLAPDGLEVVNADDPAWLRLRREHRRVTFGERGGDVTAARVTLDAAGARFELVTPMGRAEVRLPLLGRFNVVNALGVAACAWGLGVPVETIAERLTRAPQVPGRMERIAERPCTVLRDYAHTPDALERALETLRPLTKQRLIVVFGAGGDRDRGKRAPMGTVAVRLADIAIVTSDNPRTEDPEKILDDVEVGMRAKPHTRDLDRRGAPRHAGRGRPAVFRSGRHARRARPPGACAASVARAREPGRRRHRLERENQHQRNDPRGAGHHLPGARDERQPEQPGGRAAHDPGGSRRRRCAGGGSGCERAGRNRAVARRDRARHRGDHQRRLRACGGVRLTRRGDAGEARLGRGSAG